MYSAGWPQGLVACLLAIKLPEFHESLWIPAPIPSCPLNLGHWKVWGQVGIFHSILFDVTVPACRGASAHGIAMDASLLALNLLMLPMYQPLRNQFLSSSVGDEFSSPVTVPCQVVKVR